MAVIESQRRPNATRGSEVDVIITADPIVPNSHPEGPLRVDPLVGEVGTDDADIWACACDTSSLSLRTLVVGAVVAERTATPAPADGCCVVFHVDGLTPDTWLDYDLSCFAHWDVAELPIFGDIGAHDPDLFIMAGDYSYLDAFANLNDNADMAVHIQHRANAALCALVERVPTVAVWDDHDYGTNDSGASYPRPRRNARQLQTDVGAARPWGWRRSRSRHLLDIPARPPRGSPARWPDVPRARGSDARMAWLQQRLLVSTAPVKLLVSGSVVLPDFVRTIEGGTWEGSARDAEAGAAPCLHR